MQTSLILMSKLAAMMVMVVVGWAVAKLRVIENRESVTLSKLIIYIFQPCLICRSFQIELTPERAGGFLCALLLGIGTYAVWILTLEGFKRPLRLDAVDRCNLIYSNVGNLALPLVQMILGSEYVFYASALQIPFNLLVWTHGLSVISGERRLNFRKILLNPNILALAAGLLLTALRVPLPDFLDTALEGLGGMVGPCSMLMIGVVIARSDLRKVFTDRHAYVISLGRLLLMPASLLLLLWLSGILGRHPALTPIFQVCFIALCTPPAATVAQLAVLYDKKAYETGVYNVLSMAFCVLTMPLMLALYQMLFGG